MIQPIMAEPVDIENIRPNNISVFTGDVFSSLESGENQVSILMEIEDTENGSDIYEQYEGTSKCIALVLVNIVYGPFIGCNFLFTLETINSCIISQPPFGILTIHYYLFGSCVIETFNYLILSFLVIAFSRRELERMTKIDCINKLSYANLVFCVIWYCIGCSMMNKIQTNTCHRGIQSYLILYSGYKLILHIYLLFRIIFKCNNDCQ